MEQASASQSYRKRAGTTNSGTDYEILNIANIVINLVKDEKIQNFHISSNDQKFGDFDDIVIETERAEGTETVAFQLKHKDKCKLLSVKHLTQAKGDFSIQKYFTSWQTIKAVNTKFILYTNMKCNLAENEILFLEGEGFPVTVTKVSTTNAFEISQKTDNCYKFSTVRDDNFNSEKLSLYEQFFDLFFLYTGQEKFFKLKHSVIENFKTSFGGSKVECDQFIQIIREWGFEDSTKDKLDKKWMSRAIALKILSSRIKPLSFKNNDGIKRRILREAIETFDFTIFRNDSYDEIKNLWNVARNELTDYEIINKLRAKFQLTYSHISDISNADSLTLSIFLWLMGKAPLILTLDAGVQKVLKLCPGEKFILLVDDSPDSFTENTSSFQTLSDLKKNTFEYNQLIQNFTCSWQGKHEIFLKDLIDNDDEILKLFKTDDLLQMVKNECEIGEVGDNPAEPYMERCLLKSSIDFKILHNVSRDTVVILDCVSMAKDLEDMLKSHILIYVGDYLSGERRPPPTPNIDEKSHTKVPSLNTTIFLSLEACGFEEFTKICDRTESVKNFHQLRIREDGNLEWIRSKGAVNDLEKFKLSEYYPVQEHHLSRSEFANNINLLISDPGMGKSELMKSIKFKSFPEYLTINIDPKDVFAFIKNTSNDKNADAFDTFLLNEKCKMPSELEKNIFCFFLDKKKVIYTWDALDELSDEHRDIATDIIVELSEKCRQWVTSRCHMRNELERKFNVLSLNLNKFDEKEQTTYIRKRLVGVKLKKAIETISKQIESSFILVEHKDILGIPLQLFMLTELVKQDGDKYSYMLDGFFLLTQLYDYFIKEKINIFITENLPVGPTVYGEILIKSQKDKIFEEYTFAALRLLFPDALIRELLHNREKPQDIHRSHRNIGLVTEINDRIPRFLHNSFAEFLAARYLASNLQQKEVLAQVMFDSKYNNVRFFFDLILAGKSEAHVAILYKNFNFFKTCNDDSLEKKDSGGRTALHLACSWGQRYPKLKVENVGGSYRIDDDGQFGTVPDQPEFLQAVDGLLEKCDLSATDDIYKMTPREYARRASCLGVEMRIMMKEPTDKFTEIDHLIQILYHSAHSGYHHEFAVFAFELAIQEERNHLGQAKSGTRHKSSYEIVTSIQNNAGMTLLHISASMGHLKIVEFLIKAGADFDFADSDGFTPLNAASMSGRYKVAEFLVKVGADVNLENKYGFTPLTSAFNREHHAIVEFLQKKGAGVNAANDYGLTPLILASEKGHYKIVNFLTTVGADLNLANEDGFTPLISAAQNGQERIVEFLVERRAPLDVANKDGVTALNAACWHGHYKVARYLVEKGADVNLADSDGFTPIFAAYRNGHVRIVEILVEADADVNLPSLYGFRVLHAACEKGDLKMVDFLVNAEADFNLDNKDGVTPLIIASERGCYEIVDLLVEAGADVNHPNKRGITPLYVAAQKGFYKIVNCLVTAEADVNRPTKRGNTALYAASERGHYEILKLLIKAGADANLANKDGFTPIIRASSKGRYDIVEFLVKVGADVHLADKNLFTSLSAACEKGHLKIVELLVKAGANVNFANKEGFTPLHLASHYGHEEIVVFLVKSGALVNCGGKFGVTPLQLAAGRHEEIDNFLRARGAQEKCDLNRR